MPAGKPRVSIGSGATSSSGTALAEADQIHALICLLTRLRNMTKSPSATVGVSDPRGGGGGIKKGAKTPKRCLSMMPSSQVLCGPGWKGKGRGRGMYVTNW